MNKNTLQVKIDSGQRDTSADAYLHILQATIDALKEINRSSSRFGSEDVEWQIVDAGRNSPLFASIGWDTLPSSDNGNRGDQSIDAFVAGLSHLERSNTCPAHFNTTSLRTVEKFINSFARGVQGIAFETAAGGSASVSRELTSNANHARRVLEHSDAKLGKHYVEYGSIEGRLIAVSTQPSKHRDRVTIEDDLTRDEIACYFHDERVEEQARKYWKRRVAVTGEITVERETGKRTQVKVEDIRPLQSRDDLPQMEDLRGINITHGIESARYISDLRNAE